MTARMTKRTFLRSVGAAAGVGAVYRTMQALGLSPADGAARAAAPSLPAGSGAGTHVVVLGAGIAGMAAAWELAAAGYRCTVLEAAGRAGGRSLTVRRGDVLTDAGGSRQRVEFDGGRHLYANLGPARIPYHHEAVLGYCKAFGIELEVFLNDNRAALFHNRERLAGRPVTGRRAIADLRGYVAELLAKAVSRDALDSELTGVDKERVLAMLVEYGDLDPDRLYRGSSRGGYRGGRINAGLEAGDVSDPLDFAELLETDFWEYKLHFGEFLDQNPTLFQPVGGMDAIAEAFRARVDGLVRYRSVVEEIRRTPGGGVRVVYRSAAGSGAGTVEAVEADFALSTIPAPVLKDVRNDFAPETRAAIEALEFTPAVKIAFQARRRFWEEDYAIYGGISWTDQDITQIWYPSCGYHRDKGVVVGAYVWDDRPGQCERFARMAPGERLRAAIAEGERLHPGYGAEMESGISRAWSEVPFQKGAWPAGYPYEAPARLRQPDGPVHFAGDQVSALPGWQEGAVLSAHAAASAIGERVAARGAKRGRAASS